MLAGWGRLEADALRYYGVDADGLFRATEREVLVWLGGLPRESAFWSPFHAEAEERRERADELRQSFREAFAAPAF